MTLRGFLILGAVAGLAAVLAGCAKPVAPPPVVATLPPPPPPPPTLPPGAYPGLEIPGKRPNGTYVTPNFEMTDAAAVWHLRGALNVAALGCDQAGGGIVDGYNAWLTDHRAALDGYVKQYRREWKETGWWDWENAYDNNQTRLYNFYSQSPIRTAFCAAARGEIVKVDTVADADLPGFARGALVRLDKPFIDFYTAFDAWRAYYQPKVTPPPVVTTLPASAAKTTVSAPPPGDAAGVASPPTATVSPPVAGDTGAIASPPAAGAPVGDDQPPAGSPGSDASM